MHLADVLIHIDETLATTQCEHLEEELRKVKGVVTARFNMGSSHLLLVSYDPDTTNSHNLLGIVKTDGYRAQLVGM
jgi:hypothetical protein